eukprot:1705796-Rhodomonas_salina.1
MNFELQWNDWYDDNIQHDFNNSLGEQMAKEEERGLLLTSFEARVLAETESDEDDQWTILKRNWCHQERIQQPKCLTMAHIFDLVEAEMKGLRRQTATDEPATEEQINAVLGPPLTDPNRPLWQNDCISSVDLAQCAQLEVIHSHRNKMPQALLASLTSRPDSFQIETLELGFEIDRKDCTVADRSLSARYAALTRNRKSKSSRGNRPALVSSNLHPLHNNFTSTTSFHSSSPLTSAPTARTHSTPAYTSLTSPQHAPPPTQITTQHSNIPSAHHNTSRARCTLTPSSLDSTLAQSICTAGTSYTNQCATTLPIASTLPHALQSTPTHSFIPPTQHSSPAPNLRDTQPQRTQAHTTPSSSVIRGSHLTSQLTISERNRLISSDCCNGIEPDTNIQITLRMGGRSIFL